LPEERRGQAEGLSPEQAREIARLQALGYVGGSRLAPATAGVGRYDPSAAYEGLNLLNDGHDTWAGLMDMSGNVLHSWSYAFADAFPDLEAVEDNDSLGTLGNFRRVALLPAGELLAIFEGWGLVKLDRGSNLVWALPNRAHHDLEVQPDGKIYVLTRRAEIVPRLNRTEPVLHDFVTVLDADGKEIEQVSLLEAVERSPYTSLIELSAKAGDIFHTNTVEVLDGRLAADIPAFREGNVLLSMRNVDAVVVLDMEKKEIVWAFAGLFKQQHQPTLLDNNHMLVFDNMGLGERSRVLEIDLVSQQVVWSYGPEGFYTRYCGSSQRLPNGNTLITETDAGRALEVRPDGRIVWEYTNPHRFGTDDEMIASLFEVIRLPSDYPLDWLLEDNSR
jgi:hypothetical protein